MSTMTDESKRIAIVGFWLGRVVEMEQRAVELFREAGNARGLAEQAKTLPVDGIDRIFEALFGSKTTGDSPKVVVEHSGNGSVN